MSRQKVEEMQPCPACSDTATMMSHVTVPTTAGECWQVCCIVCAMAGPAAQDRASAAAAWNDMPRDLRWQKKSPTVPGWYWVKLRYMEKPHIAYFNAESLKTLAGPELIDDTLMAGPIPEPVEA